MQSTWIACEFFNRFLKTAKLGKCDPNKNGKPGKQHTALNRIGPCDTSHPSQGFINQHNQCETNHSCPHGDSPL